MAFTPPLSPTPRRWRPADEPSPLVQALTVLADEAEVEAQLMLLSPSQTPVPNITTTSPSPQRPGTAPPINPQVTGSSLAAQYDDVFAQLDALADPSFGASPPTPSKSPKGARPLSRPQTPKTPTMPNPSTPTRSALQTPTEARSPRVLSPPAKLPLRGLGINIPRSPDVMSTLSERTEAPSPSAVPDAPTSSSRSSTSPIRHRQAPITPQSTSKLIQMFESRAPPPPSPQFGPRLPKETSNEKPNPQTTTLSGPRRTITPSSRTGTPKATSSTAMVSSPVATESTPVAYKAEPVIPAPATKASMVVAPKSEPVSSVQNIIASWRERAAAAASSDPGLARKSWNVSIRRAPRSAGHAEEGSAKSTSPTQSALRPSTPGSVASPSVRSTLSIPSGEPLRTGTLYYFDCHSTEDPAEFRWVQTDARLFSDRLVLVWRASEGSAAQVILEFEECDEVESTYSPSNPMADTDFAAQAARRQGELASSLYPFKLVYPDGDESLGTSSARDRVHWVSAIGDELRRTRARGRLTPSVAGGSVSGSSSTRYSVGDAGDRVQQTSDDAVIATAGGFTAPLASRGSRRLAAGVLGRAQSLRRVASDTDMRELSQGATSPVASEARSQSLLRREPGLPHSPVSSITSFSTASSMPDSSAFLSASSMRDESSTRARPSSSQAPSTKATTYLTSRSPPHSPASVYATALTTPVVAVGQLSSPATRATTLHTAHSEDSKASSASRTTATSRTMYTAMSASSLNTTYHSLPSILEASSRATTPSAWTDEADIGSSSYRPASSASYSSSTARTALKATSGPLSAGSELQLATFISPRLTPKSGTARSSSSTVHDAPTVTSRSQGTPTSSTEGVSSENGRVSIVEDTVNGKHHSETSISALRVESTEEPKRYQLYDPPLSTASSFTTTTKTSTYATAMTSSDTAPRGEAASYYATAPGSEAPLTASSDSSVSESSESIVATTAQIYSATVVAVPLPITEFPSEKKPLVQLPSSSAIPSSSAVSSEYTTASSCGASPSEPSSVTRSFFADGPPTPFTPNTWAADQQRRRYVDSQSNYAKPPSSVGPTPTEMERDAFRTNNATPVSEPDADTELIDRLERLSTISSIATQQERSLYAVPSDVDTYRTGRQSAYVTASVISGTERQAKASSMQSSMRAPSTRVTTVPESLGPAPSSHRRPVPRDIRPLPRNVTPPSHVLKNLPPTPYTASTAGTTVGSSRLVRKPVPQLVEVGQRAPSPPPPQDPSSSSDASSSSSSSSGSSAEEDSSYTTASHRSASSATERPNHMLRLVNFLQGQETVRQGQTSRMSSQLDRIEHKVDKLDRIESKLSRYASSRTSDGPPPLPSKDGHDRAPSPALSASSGASDETARPVTPPPLIIPPAITQRLDDMSNLLGTVLGQQLTILDQLERRQTPVVELESSRHITLPRIQDLLHRILDHVGQEQNGYADETAYVPRKRSTVARDTDSSVEGPFYSGAGSVFSDEGGHRAPAPPNSHVSRPSTIGRAPDSLLDGEVGGMDFQEDLEVLGLPPDSPPREQQIPRATFPRGIGKRAAPHALDRDFASEHGEYPEQILEIDGTVSEPGHVLRDTAPQPGSAGSGETEDSAITNGDLPLRKPRKGPTPQPTGMPTPIYDRKDLKDKKGKGRGSDESSSEFRNLPRPAPTPYGPSVSFDSRARKGRSIRTRFSGRSKPVSSIYQRNNLPGGYIQTPYGMVYDFSSAPGRPGIGPMMPGVGLGMPGFGSAPGHMHPGQHGFFDADRGIGNTTSGSSSSSSSTKSSKASSEATVKVKAVPDVPVTVTANVPAATPRTAPDVPAKEVSVRHDMPGIIITAPSIPSVTGDRQSTARDVAESRVAPSVASPRPGSADLEDADPLWRLRQTQGEHQNDISRYLNQMGDQIRDMNDSVSLRLKDVLHTLDVLRNDVRRERVPSKVMPDGTVQLTSGEIVDGVRGPPQPGHKSVSVSPASKHVQGNVLPDGTVMVGDKIVDGVKGAPREPTAAEAMAEVNRLKEDAREKEIEELISKVAAVASSIRGSRAPSDNGHVEHKDLRDKDKEVTRDKEVIRETVRDHDHVVEVHPPSRTHSPPGSIAPPPSVASPPSIAPSRYTHRTNPRNAQPLSIPAPLGPATLAPHSGPANVLREQVEEVTRYPTNGGDAGHARTPSHFSNVPHQHEVPRSDAHSNSGGHGVSRTLGNVPNEHGAAHQDNAQPISDKKPPPPAKNGRASSPKPIWSTNPPREITEFSNVPKDKAKPDRSVSAPVSNKHGSGPSKTGPEKDVDDVTARVDPPLRVINNVANEGEDDGEDRKVPAGPPTGKDAGGKPQARSLSGSQPSVFFAADTKAPTIAGSAPGSSKKGESKPTGGKEAEVGTAKTAESKMPGAKGPDVASSKKADGPQPEGVPVVPIVPNEIPILEERVLPNGERVFIKTGSIPAPQPPPPSAAGAKPGSASKAEGSAPKSGNPVATDANLANVASADKDKNAKADDKSGKPPLPKPPAPNADAGLSNWTKTVPEKVMSGPPDAGKRKAVPDEKSLANGVSGAPVDKTVAGKPTTEKDTPGKDKSKDKDAGNAGGEARGLHMQNLIPTKDVPAGAKPPASGSIPGDPPGGAIKSGDKPAGAPGPAAGGDAKPAGAAGAPPHHCDHCCPNPARSDLAPAPPKADAKPVAEAGKVPQPAQPPMPGAMPLGLPTAALANVGMSDKKDDKASGKPEADTGTDKSKEKPKVDATGKDGDKKDGDKQGGDKDKKEGTTNGHKEQLAAIAELKKLMDALIGDQKTFKAAFDEAGKAAEKRRAGKEELKKKAQAALDSLLADNAEAKKEAKKLGTQAVLDALKKFGDSHAEFLRKMGAEVMEHNSNQHKVTQDKAKAGAREQVAFNLNGYLDDFSRQLSGEVRVLLKEVGDIREARRALYMEMADLLLMKGRQSGGDLMAIVPYPAKPPAKPAEKKEEKKPAEKPKGPPAWSSFFMPGAPMPGHGPPMPGHGPPMGRPLPHPGHGPPGPMPIPIPQPVRPPPGIPTSWAPQPVPTPAGPPPGAKPLPVPSK